MQTSPVDLSAPDTRHADDPTRAGLDDGSAKAEISVVVPFFNEEESIGPLVERIVATLDAAGRPYEILLVNDGSTDGSRLVAAAAALRHSNVRLVNFRRNFGKAAALSAGFAIASGETIITMDADLQDDPDEIPRFLEKIGEGYDLVSGWKRERNDPISKTWPSRVFNVVLSRVFAIKLNDFNCGFKAYSRTAAAHTQLYGDLHRYTPALLHSMGFRVTEIPVRHHPRRFGKSKYGMGRMVRGLLDLMTVLLITRYRTRPLHFFGSIGLGIGFLGFLGLSYLSVLWLLGLGPIGDRPLLLFSILLMLTGTQFLGVGLIGELLTTSTISEGKKYLVMSDIETARSGGRVDEAGAEIRLSVGAGGRASARRPGGAA